MEFINASENEHNEIASDDDNTIFTLAVNQSPIITEIANENVSQYKIVNSLIAKPHLIVNSTGKRNFDSVSSTRNQNKRISLPWKQAKIISPDLTQTEELKVLATENVTTSCSPEAVVSAPIHVPEMTSNVGNVVSIIKPTTASTMSVPVIIPMTSSATTQPPLPGITSNPSTTQPAVTVTETPCLCSTDTDSIFLRSLLDDMKSMTRKNKGLFKIRVQQVIQEILYADDD